MSKIKVKLLIDKYAIKNMKFYCADNGLCYARGRTKAGARKALEDYTKYFDDLIFIHKKCQDNLEKSN